MNRYRPHILVLPEDDANRQIALGFQKHLDVNYKKMQILPVAGGWQEAVDVFINDLTRSMLQYQETRIVLLIDFDQQYPSRFNWIKDNIPRGLERRVFVLGVLTEPEDLKRSMNKSYEEIGASLAEACVDDARPEWRHALLQHNETVLDDLIELVKPFLFS